MVEIDVRRTRDGELVVHHDEAVRGRALRDQTYDAASQAGACIARLEEYLDVVAGRMAVDVELKEPGYEADVLSMCLAKVEPDDVAVTSFSESAVAAAKRLAPEVSAGLIVGRMESPRALVQDIFPFGRLEACGADFLAPHYRLLATGIARRAKRRGIGLLVWTVNDPRLAERYLADPQVLGVITDSFASPVPVGTNSPARPPSKEGTC